MSQSIPTTKSEFEALFKAFYPAMVLLARKYVTDTDTAKDIAQQVFVHLYEKRHDLHINSTLKGYLFQSVRNAALNRLNQKKTRERHEVSLQDHSIDFQDAATAMEIRELSDLLVKLIDELPPRCSQIFKMNRFEGKKNKEIAEELNISLRTVETQISNALRLIREKLPKTLSAFLIFLLENT